MSATKPLIIFDLDGTLIDSAPSIVRSLDDILHRHGQTSSLPYEERRYWALYGSQALLKASWPKNLAEKELHALSEELIAHYAHHMLEGTVLFPGALDALRCLEKEGCRMAVCTNKREALAQKLLRELAIDHFFAITLGGDSLPFKKPSGEPLKEIMRILDTEKQNCVMIGDTLTDVEASAAAGIPCLIFDFCHHWDERDPYRTLERHNKLAKNFPIMYAYDCLVPTLKALFPVAFPD